MRKLVVSNFCTLDGFYETVDKTIAPFFEYHHPDYSGDDAFDQYNSERLEAADTLLLSGRTSYLGNLDYWSRTLTDDTVTPLRRKLARQFLEIEKLVISDNLSPDELAGWWTSSTSRTSRWWRVKGFRSSSSGRQCRSSSWRLAPGQGPATSWRVTRWDSPVVKHSSSPLP